MLANTQQNYRRKGRSNEAIVRTLEHTLRVYVHGLILKAF